MVNIGLSSRCLTGAILAVGVFVGSVLADELVVRGTIPPRIEEIEIIYPEGRPPKVSLKREATPKLSPSFKPSGSLFDLLPLLGKLQASSKCPSNKEGVANSLKLKLTAAADGICRHEIGLSHNGAALDLLSYDTLRFQGKTTGKIDLFLAARDGRSGQSNVLLAQVHSAFDIRVPLHSVAARVDLRRISALLLETHTDAELSLKNLSLEHSTRKRTANSRRGFWVWDYREALADPPSIFNTCRKVGADRIFLQLPSLEDGTEIWNSYVRFLKDAKKAGVEVFALDGFPEAIYSPAPLIEKIAKLRTLMGSTDLEGLQVDIEPYLLEDFFAIESGFAKYLEALEKIKASMPSPARLSVAVPFWFSEQYARGRAVSFTVMDLVDEVVVMSYRTNMDEVRAIAEDTLRYGDLANKSVWLGLETVPLGQERYVTLKPEPRREFADAFLNRKDRRLVLQAPGRRTDVEGFRVQRRITVRPERITFAGTSRKRVEAAMENLTQEIANRSLSGVVIHDFKGFTALSE